MSAPFLDGPPDQVAALAERYLVGACLHLRGTTAREALARVEVADLGDPQLRAVVEALQALVQGGADPDPALVAPRMVELGLVPRDKVGLLNVLLVDLLAEVPAPECWPVYAVQVLRESARRTLREVCDRAAQAADGPDLAVAVRVLTEGIGQAAVVVHRALVAESGATA